MVLNRVTSFTKFTLIMFSMFLGSAQNQNNQWNFGFNCNINFNSSTPTSTIGNQMQTLEGSASVSDENTGALLFYSDGLTVWNSNNLPMPNGSGLLGGNTPAVNSSNPFSSTSAVVIVPRPFTPNIYYVVTLDQEDSSNGMRYSIVDMNLNGGLGDVVTGQKNIPLYSTTSEKLQVVPNASGCGYWLLTLNSTGNAFVAFSITQAGINTTPTISTVTTTQTNGRGHFKINPQFTKIAMGNSGVLENRIELYDFNSSTGSVSNLVLWNYAFPYSGLNFYGVEFSPDGTKLYVSNFIRILQYDITLATPALIAASGFNVTASFSSLTLPGALQLGPDNKIYVASNPLSVINVPNNNGAACGFQLNPIPGFVGSIKYGLPQKIFKLDQNITNSILFSGTCQNTSAQFSLQNTTNLVSATWNFGDPSSGLNDIASGFTPQHTFSAPGTYIVSVSLVYPCATIVITENVTITASTTPTFNLISTLCSGTTPPTLPQTSLNGINGSWFPAIVDNLSSGFYTFQPLAGQCASNFTLSVTVDNRITPTFNPIPTFCSGTTPPILSLTSLNGITGTWSPAVVNTITNTDYIFTPDAGICATSTSLSTTVISSTTPSFNIITAFCVGTTPPNLPLTSLDGITGTWSPTIVSNTSNGTYTFTPNAGQCATNLSITTSLFTCTGPNTILYNGTCQNTSISFSLQNTTDIVSVDWTFGEPLLGVNNLGTGLNPQHFYSNSGTFIVTATVTSTSGSYTVTESITILPSIPLTFSFQTTYLNGATISSLPTVSDNGIAGTWSPAIVDNTSSDFYTFTPSVSGCYLDNIVFIDIVDLITPTFTPIPVICAGVPPPILPTTSINGITGTWFPSVIDNTTTGTYTFTPNPGQSAGTTTLFIQVITTSPSITLAAASGSSNQSVCINEFIVPILYDLGGPATGATIVGLPAGIFGSISGSLLTISGFPLENVNSPYNFTITTTGGNCGFAITTGVISVGTLQVPLFNPIPAFCAGSVAPILPLTSTNGISGTWSPALIDVNANGIYTFTPNPGQCFVPSTVQLTTTVLQNVVPVFSIPATFCSGASVPLLPTTSNNGINGSWSPSIVDSTTAGTYTFTPNPGQCSQTFSISISPNSVIPTFSVVANFCSGTVAPILPTSSLNGIMGSWLPPVIDNLASGSYTFTPDFGQCATPITVSATVVNTVVPTFSLNANPFVCAGSTPPILPTTSIEGVVGLWSPSTIDSLNSATYTFVPAAGQCAETVSLFITVTNTPGISLVSSSLIANQTVCVNQPIIDITYTLSGTATGAVLSGFPTGIFGSISGNVLTVSGIATDFSASPYNYTITTTGGNCGSASISGTLIVNTAVVPAFTLPTSFCSGAAVPILPSISSNGISGTWSPSTIDNNVSGSYIFTPSSNLCATTQVLNVTVDSLITPSFLPIPTVCFGSAAPLLPTISTNGISGSWSPLVVSTTTSASYVFTPNVGQCATTQVINITVIPSITPVFDPISPFCSGQTAPILSSLSNNGITGTWSPAIVSNTSNGTYIFSPDGGQCATTVSINVVVLPLITPVFNSISSFCVGSIPPVLPTTSVNGISGTWSPSIVDNSSSGTYTFTPTIGQCALTTILTVLVNPPTIPNFDPISLCENDTSFVLSPVSPNGIIGSWSPPIIDLTANGLYTFTPNSGQCAISQIITVTINQGVLTGFDWIVSEPFSTNATITVIPNPPGNYLYQLDDGPFQTSSIFENVSSGLHFVQVTDPNGCSIDVFENDILIIDYPKYFTPNGDGYNETWNISDLFLQRNSQIFIYDRYGKLLKQIFPFSSGWDGTYNNNEMLADDYWFTVDYDYNNQRRQFRAHFSLKR